MNDYRIVKRLQDAAEFLENVGEPSQEHVIVVQDAIRIIEDLRYNADHILYLSDQISKLAAIKRT